MDHSTLIETLEKDFYFTQIKVYKQLIDYPKYKRLQHRSIYWPYVGLVSIFLERNQKKMDQQFKKLIKEIDELYLHIVDPDKFMKMQDELTDLLHHQINLLNALNSVIKLRKNFLNINFPSLQKKMQRLCNYAENWYDEIQDRAETLAISLKAKKEIDQIVKALKCHSNEDLASLSDVLAKL